MVGASIASLVGWALEVACFANPSWFAATFGVHVPHHLAFSILSTDVVDLISGACQEAVITLEAIIAGTFSGHSTLV